MVRAEAHLVHAVLARQPLLARAVEVDAVQLPLHRRLLERREVDEAARVVHRRDRPQRGRGEAAGSAHRPRALRHRVQQRPVRGVAVEVRVAVALGGPQEALPALEELQVVRVHPARVRLAQDASRLPARAVHEVQVEPGLQAVLGLHRHAPVVGRPLHRDHVLVGRRLGVHPDGRAARDLHDAQPDRGVGAARLRIALGDHAWHHGLEVGEAHRAHRGLVRAQERDRAAVRRPPEPGVLVVEDLLPVDPGQGTVQDRARAVAREAALGARGQVQHEEVVAAHEGQPPAVGDEARDRLRLGRAREPLEAGGGEIEEEEIVRERVGRPAARPVERLGPGQGLRHARLPEQRLQARQGGRPVHGRLAAARRPSRARSSARPSACACRAAARPRRSSRRTGAAASAPPPRRCRSTRR